MIYTFDSSQVGAPVLSGTAGALSTLLKACLVDGFGASAVVSLSVSSGIATATYAAGHPFLVGRIARFAGATPTALNGDKRILSITANSVTFGAAGLPDGAATGSISSRMAPAGWQELFAGTVTNVLVIKPQVIESTGCVLRIDDSGSTNARVRAYESMSSVSVGIGPTPLDVQVSGGLYWPKSGTASATARPWFVIADERGFYLSVSPQSGDRHTLLYAGDIASYKSGDAYGFVLTGNHSDRVAATDLVEGCCGHSRRNTVMGAFVVRSHTGIGSALAAQRVGSSHTGTGAEVYAGTPGYGWGLYPNGPNNGLMLGAVALHALGMRGTLPGLTHAVQDCGVAFASGGVVNGTDGMLGRRLMPLRVAPPSGTIVPGTVFFDTTGPWER